MSLPNPVDRKEFFLAKIAGMNVELPLPVDRKEQYLAYIAEHGGGGGGTSFEVVIVEELPETGQNGKIYLVPSEDGEEPDIYDEYLWIQSTSSFERIGSTKITFQTKELTFVKDDSTTETINFMIQP